jgi:hypothetical protein
MWTRRLAGCWPVAGLLAAGFSGFAVPADGRPAPPDPSPESHLQRLEDRLQRLREEQERVMRELREIESRHRPPAAARQAPPERPWGRWGERSAPWGAGPRWQADPRSGPGAGRGGMRGGPPRDDRFGSCPHCRSCPQAGGWRTSPRGGGPPWGGRSWGCPQQRGGGQQGPGWMPRWGARPFGGNRGPQGPGWQDRNETMRQRFQGMAPDLRERIGRRLQDAGERLMQPPDRPGPRPGARPDDRTSRVDRLLKELREAMREMREEVPTAPPAKDKPGVRR